MFSWMCLRGKRSAILTQNGYLLTPCTFLCPSDIAIETLSQKQAPPMPRAFMGRAAQRLPPWEQCSGHIRVQIIFAAYSYIMPHFYT
jgi:hypothetical protein